METNTLTNLEKDLRSLAGLCDAMHLLVEGTFAENSESISHKSLSLDGGIHQLSHVLRDKSKELYKSVNNELN